MLVEMIIIIMTSIKTMAVIMVAMLPMMMVLLVRGSSNRLSPSHYHRHSDDGHGGHDGDDGADEADFE